MSIDRYKARLVAQGFRQQPVNLVSQFMHAPRTVHLQAAKRIMQYLRETSSHGLILRQSECPDTKRSTTGYAIFVGPNLISRRSKKQPTVSKSSTEAEYRALAYAVAETLWI
ncbi:hypothetical protein CRG98_029520 [Punica granatum]|uniref:Reverse transcriptase Ty1/copia-type domain-containing protein n=1 Tax=Punica granatum TaxID=22663 RepID=A0A2I0J1H9_PUNGR|nr:hypothetical protein CRG98_029520 [Punica granatum]